MGGNREKSNIAIAILDKYKFWDREGGITEHLSPGFSKTWVLV